MTFKDRYLDLQHLVRELQVLRQHNLQFKEGDPQDGLLLSAEAALVLLVLERFIRAVLGGETTDRDTLHSLLQKATSKKRGPLLILLWDDQQDGIRRICAVRNTLLHGNYEQAAREAGCATVADYFKTQFAGEIEAMYKVVDDLFKQIDPETGRRREGAT